MKTLQKVEHSYLKRRGREKLERISTRSEETRFGRTIPSQYWQSNQDKTVHEDTQKTAPISATALPDGVDLLTGPDQDEIRCVLEVLRRPPSRNMRTAD